MVLCIWPLFIRIMMISVIMPRRRRWVVGRMFMVRVMRVICHRGKRWRMMGCWRIRFFRYKVRNCHGYKVPAATSFCQLAPEIFVFIVQLVHNNYRSPDQVNPVDFLPVVHIRINFSQKIFQIIEAGVDLASSFLLTMPLAFGTTHLRKFAWRREIIVIVDRVCAFSSWKDCLVYAIELVSGSLPSQHRAPHNSTQQSGRYRIRRLHAKNTPYPSSSETYLWFFRRSTTLWLIDGRILHPFSLLT